MNQPSEGLSEALLRLITPTDVDVRQATRVVLSVLDDSRSHFTGELVRAMGAQIGTPLSESRMVVEFVGQPSAAALKSDDQVLTSRRATWAVLEAIAELSAQGLIGPGHGPTTQQDLRHYEPVPDRIGIRHPGGGEGVPVETSAPAVGEAYRLALGARRGRWYLEPSLFMENLESIGIDARAQRALREALLSYRRGLYLAAASMLGVVFESAWYQVAGASNPTGKLADALANDRTARVQELYVERMRGVRGIPPTLPSELLSHAALLRELRNYGVHPAGTIRDDLERFFEEEPIGLLILQTHHFLNRLADAARAITAQH
jgi:hypothetical protein